jgi:hypothetical protein
MTSNYCRNSLNGNQVQVCDCFTVTKSFAKNNYNNVKSNRTFVLVTEDVNVSFGVKCHKRPRRGFGRE